MDDGTIGERMKNKTLLICLAMTFVSCTAPDQARRVLDESGYSEVQLTGYRWFTCGENDVYHDGFIARGPTGRSVKGTICAGWFKGATIRLD